MRVRFRGRLTRVDGRRDSVIRRPRSPARRRAPRGRPAPQPDRARARAADEARRARAAPNEGEGTGRRAHDGPTTCPRCVPTLPVSEIAKTYNLPESTILPRVGDTHVQQPPAGGSSGGGSGNGLGSAVTGGGSGGGAEDADGLSSRRATPARSRLAPGAELSVSEFEHQQEELEIERAELEATVCEEMKAFHASFIPSQYAHARSATAGDRSLRASCRLPLRERVRAHPREVHADDARAAPRRDGGPRRARAGDHVSLK